jgi:hypothetical protein
MKTTKRHSGRIEVKPGLQAIAGMKETWRKAYQAACKYDGMPEDTKFAAFSEGNPYVQFVDRAYTEYCSMIAEYQAGGYVGLRMGR